MISSLINACRRYSTIPPAITYVEHQLTRDAANDRFLENTNHNFFARNESSKNQTQLIVRSQEDPLNPYLTACFETNAVVENTQFSAQYGIDYTTPRVVDGKIKFITKTRWRSITGTLEGTSYAKIRYGGGVFPQHLIEDLLNGYRFQKLLKPYEEKTKPGVKIDPFVINQSTVESECYDDFMAAERDRIRAAVFKMVTYADHVTVDDYDVRLRALRINSHLLPIYVLQYPHQSPRVLCALADNGKIAGKIPLSVTKCTVAGSIVLTLGSLLFPGIAIPIRVAAVIASTLFVGTYTRYRSQISFMIENKKTQWRVERNNKDLETDDDIHRRKMTQQRTTSASSVNKKIFSVDPTYILLLGLNPEHPISEDLVREAFLHKIKLSHPDHGGTEEAAIKLYQARNELLKALRLNNPQPE